MARASVRPDAAPGSARRPDRNSGIAAPNRTSLRQTEPPRMRHRRLARRWVADNAFAFTRRFPYMSLMQSQNPLLDELSKAANAAVSLAQAAGEEAKSAFRSGVDRMATDMDLIRRDEFEALKAEVAALRTELAALKTGGAAPDVAKPDSGA